MIEQANCWKIRLPAPTPATETEVDEDLAAMRGPCPVLRWPRCCPTPPRRSLKCRCVLNGARGGGRGARVAPDPGARAGRRRALESLHVGRAAK